MKKVLLTASVLFLLPAVGATAADVNSAYREALLKELNDRKLAGLVVSALAEAHRGTPQGEFWLAYSQLEADKKCRRTWARRHKHDFCRSCLTEQSEKTKQYSHTRKSAACLCLPQLLL